MTEWLQEKTLKLKTKPFFIVHVWNFFLENCTLIGLDPLLFLIFFSYGAVEITSLETNKVLKVNEHRLKPFYKGWMAELTAFMELVEPIYEAWTCDVLSQWHKQKRLLGGNPAQKEKKSDLLSFSLIFYFSHFILFLSFSYIPFLLFQHWGQCCV